jgi:plastocyanin
MAVAAGTLAATGTAPAAAATSAQSGTTPVASFVGCASLTSNANGRAQVKNICGSTINATVSVDWSWDPDCKSIGAGRSVTFTWNSTAGRAEYAYEC